MKKEHASKIDARPKKQQRKRKTTLKQARAYRRRLAKDIQREPERIYGKTSAASTGRHICPSCMTPIAGESCACGHQPPAMPKKLERTKGTVPVDHLQLNRPCDRQSAERIADAILGQSKAPRGLDRISEPHRPPRRTWI